MKIIKRPVVLMAEEKAEWLEHIARLGDPEKVFFMDIETTGFSRTYDSVYLTGFLYYEGGQFFLEQHLASDLRDEPEIIDAFCGRLSDADRVVTFNGDMFDFPFMESRRKMMHSTAPWPAVESVDLLRRYRPYQTLFGWENCRLKTIERAIGVDREDVFSGGELIEVFETYALQQDPDLEKVLLLHNYEDILNIPRLLRIDAFLDRLQKTAVEEMSVCGTGVDTLKLRIVLAEALPLSLETDLPLDKKGTDVLHFRTEAFSPVLFLTVPVMHRLLFHYLSDPEQYYYLPESDSIIHKSLADTLGPVKKRKATAKNCRIPKEGDFLPGRMEQEGLHTFRTEKKEPVVYYDKEEFTHWLETCCIEQKTGFLRSVLQL
ncbi:MAG: ribonuclease H-like domain-containing protein [Clostridiales bacterium]|nr:ribonuclease H-like domain-containing protein [Clostridiales bacterium]